jgi:hypothetical protein
MRSMTGTHNLKKNKKQQVVEFVVTILEPGWRLSFAGPLWAIRDLHDLRIEGDDTLISRLSTEISS